jgi:hypothetical protein
MGTRESKSDTSNLRLNSANEMPKKRDWMQAAANSLRESGAVTAGIGQTASSWPSDRRARAPGS